MAKKETVPNPRRKKSPIGHGRRVPRPIEKWLAALLGGDWTDKPGPEWVGEARKISKLYGCQFVYDSRRRWQESAYISSDESTGLATIFLGGAGATRLIGLSAFSHELSHHILLLRGQEPSDLIECEERTWEIANELADNHKLPICPKTRRNALYSYRHWQLLVESRGSKRQTRQQKPPKADRLLESKRGSGVSRPIANSPIGKKGKRMAKKSIKKATNKAERRTISDLD